MIYNMIAKGSGITPTGTIAITDNGTYNVEQYASADVNIASNPPVLKGVITIVNNTSAMLNIQGNIQNISRDGETFVGTKAISILKNKTGSLNVVQQFFASGDHYRGFGIDALIFSAMGLSGSLSVTYDSAFSNVYIIQDSHLTGRYILCYNWNTTPTQDYVEGTITIS